MLEEIVTVVDASSRQALQELVGRIGLGGAPMPSLFRALNPKLSEEDKRVSPTVYSEIVIRIVGISLDSSDFVLFRFRW